VVRTLFYEFDEKNSHQRDSGVGEGDKGCSSLKNPQNHYKALSVHVSTDGNWTGGACKGLRVNKLV
jgi:hypothetical protein